MDRNILWPDVGMLCVPARYHGATTHDSRGAAMLLVANTEILVILAIPQ